MKYLFCVSLPRSGHHVAEELLREIIKGKLKYCEFYTVANCCKKIPCKNLPQFEQSDCLAFMQKSHDFGLLDPMPKNADQIVVQIREPIARLLSNYELEVKNRNGRHDVSYQEYWSARESFYVAGFYHKWVRSSVPDRVLLRYEDLISASEKCLAPILTCLGIDNSQLDLNKLGEVLKIKSSTEGERVKRRTIGGSKYYHEQIVGMVANFLVKNANYLGYQIPSEVRCCEQTDQFNSLISAADAWTKRSCDVALEKLEYYRTLPNSSYAVLRWIGQVYASCGQLDKAIRYFEFYLELENDCTDTLVELSRLYILSGKRDLAQKVANRALDTLSVPGILRSFIINNFDDPSLISHPNNMVHNKLGRDVVITYFRAILGRDPESERTIERHASVGSIGTLRRMLILSPEFQDKYQSMRDGETSGKV